MLHIQNCREAVLRLAQAIATDLQPTKALVPRIIPTPKNNDLQKRCPTIFNASQASPKNNKATDDPALGCSHKWIVKLSHKS